MVRSTEVNFRLPNQRVGAMINTRRFKQAAALVIAITAGLGSPLSYAATASTTFAVQASILSACSLTATPLVFGVYSPTGGGNIDNTSVVSVFCTVGTSFTLKLNIGTGGGTYATRTLSNGSDTLNYNLYTTSGRTTVWGDGTASTGTVTGSGTGLLTASTHTVHGRLPPGQDVPPGSYQSVVTVTLEYT
jgi:spore coat protein U-like protein